MRSILFVLGCGCYDWSDAAAGARCAPLRVIHVFQHSAEPGQHRTIPALRLKHRSGSCGTASALPKCSIMSGCGTRIVLRGQKPLALCDRCPCFGSLFPPLAALTFACSIQYYLRFWLSSCRTSLAVSALRIMRYCLSIAKRRVPCPHGLARAFLFLLSAILILAAGSHPSPAFAGAPLQGSQYLTLGMRWLP